MRIKKVEIANYKGIKFVSVGDLDRSPVLIISGKNGTGKTQVLEAITTVWEENFAKSEDCIGPWGETARVTVQISLSEEERAAIGEWQTGREDPSFVPPIATVSHSWSIDGTSGYDSGSHPIPVLRNSAFQKFHRFGVLDYLPALRSAHSIGSASLSIDLGFFGEDRRDQERKSSLDGYLKYRGTYNLGDVLSYLTTADYLDLVAQRNGDVTRGEFDALVEKFFAATGKKIGRPEVDLQKGVSISVTTSSGVKHGIDQLSSGEREVINMMYFVRRLSANGGVLILDEPEQHLHPTLQVALFDAMEQMASRSQVIAVTHSPGLIASLPPGNILEMSTPAPGENVSQMKWTLDDKDKMTLMADLGLRASSLVQADALLLVEGQSDETFLPLLFPVEMSRCRMVVSGDVYSLMQDYRSLMNVGQVIPWMCIRDRDMLDRNQVEQLSSSHPKMHIWRNRMIENELLDPELISYTLNRAGQRSTAAEVEQLLRVAADELKEEVLHQLLQMELDARFKVEKSSLGTKVVKLKASLRAMAESFQRKHEELDSVLEEVTKSLDLRWESDWRVLVNGKMLMGAIVKNTPFGRPLDLANALCAAYALGEVSIQGLDEFAAKIHGLFAEVDV